MAKLTFVYRNARIHQEKKLNPGSPDRKFWMNRERKEIAEFPRGMIINSMIALAGGRPVRRGWALSDNLVSLRADWVSRLANSVKVIEQVRNIDTVDLMRAEKSVSNVPSKRTGLSVSESQSRIVYGDDIIDEMKLLTKTAIFGETVSEFFRLVSESDGAAVSLMGRLPYGPKTKGYYAKPATVSMLSQYFAFKHHGDDLRRRITVPGFSLGHIQMLSVLDGPTECLVSSGSFIIELPEDIAQDYLDRYRKGSGLATFADGGIVDLHESCKEEDVANLPSN